MEAVKIYILMALISAIAAASHRWKRRETTEPATQAAIPAPAAQ
jgi:hypothetical protein